MKHRLEDGSELRGSIDIQNARVNTAGAYVCIHGLYVFAIGIRPYQGRIPIVRLGGHREGNETGRQCAVREVYEESNLRITPLIPHKTYLCDWDHLESPLQEIRWKHRSDQEPTPLLVVTYCREQKTHLSLMYLAQAEGIPAPSSEVKGLLLLTREEVHRLSCEPLTLEQYLNSGGRAFLNAAFNTKLVLEPFAQLRLLSRILDAQPERSKEGNI